eukprot:1293118-Ditylum_brightwellii.AAC.1
MHAKTYLSKILKNRGWECGMKEEDEIIKPIHPDLIKELESAIGPSSEVESIQLEEEEDIGYAVYQYLQQTIGWGLIFWRHEPREELPKGTHTQQAMSNTDQKFVGPKKADQLAIYVNAAHATAIKQRRSIGGQTALFTGTAISYSVEWQITVATSSAKAEFFQAVLVTEMAKYLQT